MKHYFDAIIFILSCSPNFAEKWLDRNTKKLSYSAKDKDDAIEEILSKFPNLKKQYNMNKLTVKEKKLVKEYAKRLTTNKINESSSVGLPRRLDGNAIDRMRSIVDRRSMQSFFNEAQNIAKTLSDDGFEAKDIYSFLWMELLNNDRK